MPEGPSIVILKETVSAFAGKKILAVEGNTKEDKGRLLNKKVIAFRSWGKHFLICFRHFSLRIHLLMFGSYTVNARKEKPIRLGLTFSNGEVNFYTCSVKFIEEPLEEVYDWRVDTMAPEWDPEHVLKLLRQLRPDTMVCDALLNQDIFADSGNIVKNEVLFRIRVQPETFVQNLPPKKKKELIAATRAYCFDFYEWKKAFVLRKHWLVHTKKHCVSCGLKLVLKYTGKTARRSFFCPHCQKLYALAPVVKAKPISLRK